MQGVFFFCEGLSHRVLHFLNRLIDCCCVAERANILLPHSLHSCRVRDGITFGVSRKLRPRKLRPQTRKTQTLGCLENSDLEKTQTLGCLENSDPKNSDPWMSRKLRPEKLRPSGCLENSDPKNKTYLHRVNAASRLV